ncbi:hypothetical protein GGI19_000638 [Coemansia pectinata]|uniref:ATP-dependent bile acid permease n=1 Tax=Coemansia pectinata TaxID=1052879 RepID=A0A9W8H0H8_9FUNG|nr:hypothetical protein GGI19_000638 [Coemansia pectinata]
MVTIARAVSSATFAAIAVGLLHQATSYVSFYLGNKHHRKVLCGKGSHWDWSLDSDCFRVGFLWPVLVMLAAGLSSAALAVYCLLPSSFHPTGVCGVGNRGKPVRRPLGPAIMCDNRAKVGHVVMALSIAQAALLIYAWDHKAEADLFTHAYMSLMALFAALIVIANAAFLGIYVYNDCLLYAGLFPWPLPTLVLLHLLIGLCEIYYSFFTPATRNVPIIGPSASLYSNALVVTTLTSAILALSYLCVQLRPVFVRPLVSGSIADLEQLEYSTANNIEANGNDDDDDEATPLSSRADKNTASLVESPEFNVSWYSTLSYSWLSDILRKGSTRQLEATDLYCLDESDMPIPSWRRYLRHRKPGRSLLATLLIVFAPQLMLQTALSLTTTVLQFSGPFFLQRILRSIEVLGGSNGGNRDLLAEKSIRSAYLDAFGLLFFTLAAATLSNQSPWVGRHTGLRIKGILVAELSSKTLRRRGKGSLEDKTPVDDERKDDTLTAQAAADGKIMNLVSADFLRVVEAFAYPDKALSLPLMLLIGIWYMYMLLGVSALVGLTMTVLYMPLSKALLTYVARIEEKLASLSDERVTVITELLQGIKAVKLFGWESRFLEMVDERRERQLKYVWRSMVGWVGVSAGSSLAPMLVLVAIFAVYVIGFGNKLTAEIAFTSISVFQFMREAFIHLPEFSSWIIGGYVALGRIDSYLSQPQVQDLEKRVAHADSDRDELGFEGADLEWESPSSDTKPDNKRVVAGKDLSGVETPDVTEHTLLLADSTAATTPHTQIALSSANGPYSSLNHDDLVRFALKDIDVRFPHGELSIVAGPTGSGKSSLLSALVGEMTLTHGRILLPTVNSRLDSNSDYKYRDIIELSGEGLAIRDIAYVAQEAWLQNATIRKNILFGEQYDASRYEEVLRVCALKPDLRILSAGDQTEIGERGVTLSGGQKQRVALARAVYSSRRILLIDDCLSAVDTHTAKHILMECLLSKTPLMLGRTRVLVTHHVAMCLPFAEYIVLLREGQVSLKGNPAELQNQGVFNKVLAELESSEDKKEAVDAKGKGKDAEQATLTVDILDEEDPSKSVNDTTSEDEYNLQRLKRIAEQRGLDPDDDLSALQGTLVKDEERESGYVKSEVWLTYLNSCGNKWFWIGALTLLISCELMVVLHTYWIRIWVASTSSSFASRTHSELEALSSSEQQHHSAVYWIGIYVVIGVVGVIWRVLQMCFIYSGAVRAARSLHSQLLRRVVRATPRFFDSTPLGRIINRFSRDMYTIDESTMDPIVWWLRDILSTICVFAIITAVMPSFILVAISVSILYVGIAYYYVNASRELKRHESTSMSPLLSLFGELILGVSTIRAFGAKRFYIREALNRINAHNRAFYLTWATKRWLSIRIDFAGAVVTFASAIFILGSLDWMDAGLAGFVLSMALTFPECMLWVVRNYSTNELNMNSIERVCQYLKLEQEAALFTTPENKPPSDWPKTGSVQIEDLVVGYVPGVPVLHGLSLTAKHGEKIGVVGRTGAGKSTMSLAFLRFIEAARGRIFLDNVDIAKIGLEELRRNVTIIPQDPVLFNGTIRFNLDPFGEYPDELVWDALKRAHLVRERDSQTISTATSVYDGDDNANEVGMERMSGIFAGFDAEIKENGQNLSLGQRQLVALARALVRRPRLIIMDEATASVDFDTDDRIQRTIRGAEFASSTLFCIAHRLRTIIDYDRVLVLDKGKVAEFDTPWNLLQREGGIFRSMCEKSGEYEHLVAAAQRKSQLATTTSSTATTDANSTSTITAVTDTTANDTTVAASADVNSTTTDVADTNATDADAVSVDSAPIATSNVTNTTIDTGALVIFDTGLLFAVSSADSAILASAFFALVEWRAGKKLNDIQHKALRSLPGLANKYSNPDKVVTPTTLIQSMSIVLPDSAMAYVEFPNFLAVYYSK